MKILKFIIFPIAIILLHLDCFSQEFSIGWANLGTRFISNKEKYKQASRDLISPGFELQIAYHFRKDLSMISGVNYQTLFFNTPLKKDETNRPDQISSVLLRDLSIPILFRYNFAEKETHSWGVTAGIYYAIPIFALYAENQKIYGGGGYVARSINYWISGKYSFSYFGASVHKKISSKWEIYAEPFLCYQLNENDLSREVRNRFWFGLKIGMSYSFKIKNKENDN